VLCRDWWRGSGLRKLAGDRRNGLSSGLRRVASRLVHQGRLTIYVKRILDSGTGNIGTPWFWSTEVQ
jgi:hypothetical protein